MPLNNPRSGIIEPGIDERIARYKGTDTIQISSSSIDDIGNLTIGTGAAGVDYFLKFLGETNEGLVTWKEDEDYFEYSDDIFMVGSESIFFNDTNTKIRSLTSDLIYEVATLQEHQYRVDGAIEVQIRADIMEFNNGVTQTNLRWAVDGVLQMLSDGQIQYSVGINNVTFGSGQAGIDFVLNFDGETNDGKITWMEDEDRFQFADDVMFEETAVFDAEFDNGNSGAADTVDWNQGNKQKSTLTANVTYTFTDPQGPCNLILKLVQDATGSRTATWPASVKWPGGTAPTLTTTANAIDIMAFYFDETNYYGQSALDFS